MTPSDALLVDARRTRAPHEASLPAPFAPRLRLGMIHTSDPDDPTAISGLPYAAAAALRGAGCDVVPLDARPAAPRSGLLRDRLRAMARGLATQRVRDLPAIVRSRRPGCVLDGARVAARRAEAAIVRASAAAPLDALVGMCVSVPLAFLSTDLPVVYASDATARIVLATYPRYARRHRIYREECEQCEALALRRATIVALAAESSIVSAERDYGVAPSRLALVPLGCNVVSAADEDGSDDVPTRRCLRLLIVASDPERKRVRLAVDATGELRRRGIDAELWHVGPSHRSLRASWVRSAGPLRLDDEQDRARHRHLLRSAHVSVLPSRGEAFGIAPAESALVGRPAVVSDAGGLPTVVRHGETGLVLPVEAGAIAWAAAIESLVDDPDRYRRLARAARERAAREFTWERWAERIVALVERAISVRQRT